MNPNISFLEHTAYNLRVSSIMATTAAGSGHVTSCLSAADIVTAIFFHAMRFDPNNPDNPNNDRFILSKGHAAPLLYAVWKELAIVSEEDLLHYRKFDSQLEGHPTPRFSRYEAATGSLGQGLSIGAGMAFAARIGKRPYYTYVLMGDSETAEGSVWEAVQLSAFYKLNNLIGIVDCNRLGQSTETIDDWLLNRYAEKFSAFGWHPFIIDGHNMQQIIDALDNARKITDKPSIIIAQTKKGYGILKTEDKQGFHGKPFSQEELPAILDELKKKFFKTATFNDKNYAWKPTFPDKDAAINEKREIFSLEIPQFKPDEKIATRKAYGLALVELGKQLSNVISLDAEVKNSTFAELFEKAFPERFIQCFIAEQNMVGMAVGLAARHYIPFASTFGVFFARAFDQIRMAAIGKTPLRLVGSHAGVSIGEDGPSQMALEDIALLRTIPESIILYPSDATSTFRLVELMAHYDKGISYLRTTRPETPILYDSKTNFVIGGCHVLRKSNNDVACIIAAGITLFEALKAYEHLHKKGISVSIIDLYCIKPLPLETIKKQAKQSNNCIITVEDHYMQGGIGEAIANALKNSPIRSESLAVTQLPRSGSQKDLLAYEEIDAAAIIKKVHTLVG